jgi:integrase
MWYSSTSSSAPSTELLSTLPTSDARFVAPWRPAGLDPQLWTPRELHHSFVSLLSSSGVPIEDISHLVGHASKRVTELIYAKSCGPSCGPR